MTRDRFVAALDHALDRHVAALFSNMCVGTSDEGADGCFPKGYSRHGFTTGLTNAIRCYDAALAAYDVATKNGTADQTKK